MDGLIHTYIHVSRKGKKVHGKEKLVNHRTSHVTFLSFLTFHGLLNVSNLHTYLRSHTGSIIICLFSLTLEMKNQVYCDLNMSACRTVFVTVNVISVDVRTMNVLIFGFFIRRNIFTKGIS